MTHPFPTQNNANAGNQGDAGQKLPADVEPSAHFEQLYQRQQALADIELAISQYYNLQNLLDRITQVTTSFLPASGGSSLILWDEESEDFFVSSSTIPGQPPQMTAKRVRRKGGATRWIVDNRQPFVVSDIRQDPFTANKMLPEYALQAYAGFPLLLEGNAIGVLYALDTNIREYTESDRGFLTALANRAAIMIQKVRTYEQLKVANTQLEREALEKAQLIDELQEALANIKILRGLIPICANCKNVRDDEGFWQQVEIYISCHSEAEFSHSICPECMGKLYPGYGRLSTGT